MNIPPYEIIYVNFPEQISISSLIEIITSPSYVTIISSAHSYHRLVLPSYKSQCKDFCQKTLNYFLASREVIAKTLSQASAPTYVLRLKSGPHPGFLCST